MEKVSRDPNNTIQKCFSFTSLKKYVLDGLEEES